MNNDKPWYEKLSVWIGIIASICTILGVSVFSIINYLNENSTTSGDNITQHETEIANVTPEPETPSVSDPIEENKNNYNIGTPFVVTTPQQSAVVHAELSKWNEESDRDIIGNTYSSAIKLLVYDLVYAIGGGSTNITADLHFPLGEKMHETLIMSFVVAQDMVGNGSSAYITILSGEEELFPSFFIDSSTTDELVYEVELDGIRDLIIRFDCNASNNGFCVGIVLEDKED